MNETISPVPPLPPPPPVDSHVFFILLCAMVGLVTVPVLALVARWVYLWLRGSRTEAPPPPPPNGGPPPPNQGPPDLRALPVLSYGAVAGGTLEDCPICLAQFEEDEQIRVLPPCGHAFHVPCIDRWLDAHSSCPSCRRVIVVSAASSAAVPAASSSAAVEEELPVSAAAEGSANASFRSE